MEISLLTRFKSFIDPMGTAKQLLDGSQKGSYGGDHFPYSTYSTGLDARNHDFTANEYGAAQASQLLVDIAASLNVWEQWLDGITWHIRDINTGQSLLTTDERMLKDETVKGARFFKAIKKYRERYKHSYWKSIAISDWVTGETYIRRVRNVANIPTELQWLNPLSTEPFIVNGRITHYDYYNDDSMTVGYTINIQDMAYRMLRRNLFDDLRGLSPVLSIIDESNLSRNVKRAFKQYFRNGMILGGIVSPDNPETVYSPSEQDKIQRMLSQNNRGVDNAHSWIISPKKIFVQAFDSKDAGKDIQVLDNLRGSIMMALGVPEELAGNPTQATYENLEATLYNWYKLRGIPYARDIAEYHNNQIIPFIDGSGIYIEPELSKYEIERPEVVSQDVTAGVISLYDAQVKRGKTEADETLENIYIINGRPMHRDVIVKLASTFPSEEIEQRASAEESLASAEAKPAEAQAQLVDAEKPEPVQEPPAPLQEVEEEAPEPEKSAHTHDYPHKSLLIADTLYPDDDTMMQRIQDELKTWYSFEKKRYGKKDTRIFESAVLEPYLKFAIIDRIDNVDTVDGLSSAILDVFEDDAVKTKDSYRRQARSLFKKLWASEYNTSEFVRGMGKLIEQQYTQAFKQGVYKAGQTLDDLSGDELAELDLAILDEKSNVFQIMRDIMEDRIREDVNLNKYRTRAELWIARYDRILDLGYVIAMRDAPLLWEYNERKEHCVDCQNLNGRIYKASIWRKLNIEPKSARLACFGAYCGCNFRRPPEGSAITRGRPPRIRGN